MKITKEISSWNELRNNTWSIDSILEKIEEFHLENEFLSHLEVVFFYESPTDVELNDYIRFEFNVDDFIDNFVN